MEKQGKSVPERTQEIAEAVHRDENDCPVLNLQVRYYDKHLFLRSYHEDGTVAQALGCRNLAEAIVLGGDAIRRAAPRAKQLRAGQKAVATKRKAGTLKPAGVKVAATRAANKAANAS